MTMRRGPSGILSTFAATLLAACGPQMARADDTTGKEFFEKKIRPVLVQHCYKCHSANAKAPKGGLRVDSRAGLHKGGESGPAVVPGKPAESLIVQALRHEG